MKYIFVLISFVFTFFACQTKPNISNKDVLLEHRDTTVNPGTDFFQYANGSWIKKNDIPAEESAWGIGNLVVDEINEKLKKICQDAENKEIPKGNSLRLVRDYWKTAMDSTKCERLGIQVLQNEFQRIESIRNLNELVQVIGVHHRYGVNSLMDMYVYNDLKNSEKISLYLSQGGLGLPNRDYYFNNDEQSTSIRKAYPLHISKMLELAGEAKSNADLYADRILALETVLAHKSKKLEDLRDPHANYNVYTKTKLLGLNKVFNWDIWRKELHLEIDTIIVGQPEFFQELDNLFSTVDLDTWKKYLKWNLIHSFASTLNSTIDQENFAFYGKKIHGIEVQKPRWKRSLRAIENSMGDNLGREYVKYFFGPKEKQRYSDMVENVRNTFAEHIETLDWMSPETKVKALEKLKAMQKKVGYPDEWKDFSKMNIDTISYFENELASRTWWFEYSLNKIGKPANRKEWSMTPQTYNAYYSPSNNEIVLPAAIFTVPGMKDELLDDATVYGYAGASTIGHEITHGFDDEGRKFDLNGNLNDWWTAADAARFNEKTARMVKQFNAYVVLDSLHINGEATLGENIADLGGVVLGLDAFKKTTQYKEGKKINDLNPLQRYFQGYALGWLGHSRKEYLANQILSDVHSPIFLRVNGPFSNVAEFYEAYQIKTTDAMYRPDSTRIKIW